MGPNGLLRRLPGWPRELLHEVLNKHFTEGFYSDCNGGDNVRRVSDDAFASSSKGVWCGTCHVVWIIIMLNNCRQYQILGLQK